MPRPEAAGAVVYAKDLNRVATFYAEVLEAQAVHREDDHVVFALADFALYIVAIPRDIAAAIDIATPPVRRSDTPIKLLLPVASISAARAIASRFGGALNAADREWLHGETRVCDGLDPEGNVVQFRERRA